MSTNPLGSVDFSELLPESYRRNDNLFEHNQQAPNEEETTDCRILDTDTENTSEMTEKCYNPVFKRDFNPIFDIDALNQGFTEAYMQVYYGIAPNTTAGMGKPSFNPFVEPFLQSQQGNSQNMKRVPYANQGNIQYPFPLQLTPSRRPSTLSYGMSLRKDSDQATPYDIMHDFISRNHVFTHEQKVYIYNNKKGYYQYMPPYKVEQLITQLYRDRVKESGSGAFVEKVYKTLLKEPGIVRDEVPLSDPNKISFTNCTVDLQTGNPTAHSPEDKVTYALTCDLASYDNQSQMCPVFDRFLRDISRGDIFLEQRIWEMFGYCLTPDTNAKVFFLLQGVPDSGKSLLCNLLSDFFPEDKFSAMNVHSLKEQFAMGNLDSVALCVSPDLPASKLDPKSASCIKQLTGNDKISAPVKYRKNTQFRFEGKLILATNYPLLTAEADDAFMQRAVVIPFLYSIPKSAQNLNLLSLMKAEKPAIAVKALDAYARLRNNHYVFSGNYAVNPPMLYPEQSVVCSGITPLVYNFLIRSFEQASGELVAVETAYDMFMREVSDLFSYKMFSSEFQRLAEEIYGAEHIRSYHGGLYENARSTMRGIRLKNT